MSFDTPHIKGAVVRVLIVDPTTRRLILVKSRKRMYGWELPGGRVELGELPVDAAMREVREETGLSIEHLHAHSYIDRPIPHDPLVVWRAYFFSAQVPRPQITIDRSEILDCCQVSLKIAREMRASLDIDSQYFIDRIEAPFRSR